VDGDFAVPKLWYSAEAVKRRTLDARRRQREWQESMRLTTAALQRQQREREEARRREDPFRRLDDLEKQMARMGPAAAASR
jgi:hypothetical protein